MRKLLLLILTITASVVFASPPVQDENLPDQVVKEPVVEKELTVEADYQPEKTPEAELEPEPEKTAIQTNRNIVSVEEAVVELESETNMKVENEKEEIVGMEEPTLEADYMVAEDPEIQMEPGRGSRRANTGMNKRHVH
ncbi:hypothetical protein QQF64_032989 [Cirrhinus molitorella]|uniref:Secreted protein n=1 Tax=Cirrhinus molitorella TaxID=172907 RepID=A0ABR3MSL5_9TELE